MTLQEAVDHRVHCCLHGIPFDPFELDRARGNVVPVPKTPDEVYHGYYTSCTTLKLSPLTRERFFAVLESYRGRRHV